MTMEPPHGVEAPCTPHIIASKFKAGHDDQEEGKRSKRPELPAHAGVGSESWGLALTYMGLSKADHRGLDLSSGIAGSEE